MNTIPRYGIKTMYREIPLDDGQYMVAEEVLPVIGKLQTENFWLISANAKLKANISRLRNTLKEIGEEAYDRTEFHIESLCKKALEEQ